MSIEEWKVRWQNNQIGFHRAEPNRLLIEYFDRLNLASGDKVFVPLCGKSVDMIWLAAKGLQVIGVEVSKLACEAFFNENELAYKMEEQGDFVKYTHENIIIYAGDYFKLSKQHLSGISAVYDRAALIALPPEVCRPYVDHLFAVAGTGLQILLLTMAYKQDEMPGPPFSVSPADVDSLYAKKLSIDCLYEVSSEQVSEHLHANGLRFYTDYVFFMS